jgi:hypothetical protein
MRSFFEFSSVILCLVVSFGWLVRSAKSGGGGGDSKWLFRGHGAVAELRSAAEVEAALGAWKSGPAPGTSPRLAVFYAHVRCIDMYHRFVYIFMIALECTHSGVRTARPTLLNSRP